MAADVIKAEVSVSALQWHFSETEHTEAQEPQVRWMRRFQKTKLDLGEYVDTARFCLLAAVLFCFVGELSSAYPEINAVKIAAVQGADAPSKFENGLQIFWRSTSFPGDPHPGGTDAEARVRIFEGAQRELVVCRLASAIRSFDPSFTGVSIYDVSARRPGFIAVAAVYSRTGGSPLALLLYFDWSGSLSRRVVLSNRPEIQSLEVVSADQVWALNDFRSNGPE